VSPDLEAHDAPDHGAGRTGRAGHRAAGGVLATIALGVVVAVVGATLVFARRATPVGGGQLGAGAALVRGSTRLAGIERRLPPRGRGRLPTYLAPARGPAVDSARVGALTPRLVAGTEAGAEPVIALVPRDSVRGLRPLARLVVTPGEPGLLVFGVPAQRP
jgi:hypothetical protein